jgi:hypothetical protein
VELGFGFGTFLGRLAPGHDGRSKPGGEVFGELVGLVSAINVDSLAGGVYNHFAVMAGPEVFFDFHKKIGIDLAVEVIG